MKFLFRRKFRRQYKQLPEHIQEKFGERRDLMRQDIYHPLLNTHKLRGKKEAFMSINITGDYRVVFLWEGDVITFHEIGTHSELYG